MKSTDNKKDRFKVLRIIKNVILSVVIVFLSLILILTVVSRIMGKAPSLFGFSLYRVSSGSMTPELAVGDIILVRQCEGTSVQKGDIVTYSATEGVMEGRLVTHRVAEAPYQKNGVYYVVTKGDANLQNDDPIKASQITAKLVVKLAFLNFFFDFFATPWGLLALIALIILAFFNEIIIFVKALFGIGLETEPKESVEELIARYKKEDIPAQDVSAEGDAAQTEEPEQDGAAE